MMMMNKYIDKIVVLKMYVSQDDKYIYNKYQEQAKVSRNLVDSYLVNYFERGSNGNGNHDVYIDCGFDLFCPDDVVAKAGSTTKINMRCKCATTYMGIPCGFYLYPRSSVGTKTPLRLANSVGIIDSGYRGDCIAVFDNKNNGYNGYNGDNEDNGDYIVSKGDRLVQLCSGNLIYPIYPIIVDSVEELGNTSRGNGGFGSTGI